jgi:hypothetical protein
MYHEKCSNTVFHTRIFDAYLLTTSAIDHSGIGAHVDSVLRAAAPLQSLLHVPADRIRPGVGATGSATGTTGTVSAASGSALLSLLPPPLYTLFCAAYAHRAAYAGEVEVRIDGDEGEARAWLAQERAASASGRSSGRSAGGDFGGANGEDADEDDASANGGDEANGESAHKRAKTTVHGISWWPASRQAAASSSSSASSSSASAAGGDDNDSAIEADDLFSRHPLRVVIQINAATESSDIAASTTTATTAPLLVMQFVYLHRLDLVTVTPSSTSSSSSSSSSSSPLPLSSLAHLFAPALDAGTALPLGKHDVLVSQRRARAAFDARAHGLAFRWAQQLCGLHAADPNPPLPPSEESITVGVTAAHLIAFADCVRACRVRVLARALLRRHTARLARLEYPFDFDAGNRHSAASQVAKQPPPPRTRFASFAPIASHSPASSGHHQSSSNASASDEVFRVVMQRAPLPDVEARVTVGANYPAVAPHFALRFVASGAATGAASWDATASQLARRADPASLQFVRNQQQQQQHDEDDNDVLVGGSDRAAALRDLEREMNACAHSVFDELFGSAEAAAAAAGSVGGDASAWQSLLLPALIRKLQVCVDILADSEASASAAASSGASDGATGSGRVFERLVRGRDRRRPFWFNGLMFDQR